MELYLQCRVLFHGIVFGIGDARCTVLGRIWKYSMKGFFLRRFPAALPACGSMLWCFKTAIFLENLFPRPWPRPHADGTHQPTDLAFGYTNWCCLWILSDLSSWSTTWQGFPVLYFPKASWLPSLNRSCIHTYIHALRFYIVLHVSWSSSQTSFCCGSDPLQFRVGKEPSRNVNITDVFEEILTAQCRAILYIVCTDILFMEIVTFCNFLSVCRKVIPLFIICITAVQQT
jgi:hypothetical protein